MLASITFLGMYTCVHMHVYVYVRVYVRVPSNVCTCM